MILVDYFLAISDYYDISLNKIGVRLRIIDPDADGLILALSPQ